MCQSSGGLQLVLRCNYAFEVGGTRCRCRFPLLFLILPLLILLFLLSILSFLFPLYITLGCAGML